jgi:hypothetical protein
MIQTLFPNNDAVFQDDSVPIHTAGIVQSCFEEQECEFQHVPWPAQSLELNTTEPRWSVLETRVRNIFPPPKSPKQHEDILQEKWYKFRQEAVQNLYESISRRAAAVLRAKMVQHSNNKEMSTVSVVYTLFCPALVSMV